MRVAFARSLALFFPLFFASLTSSPGLSQTTAFDGFLNAPAGGAQLSVQAGALTVSNLGSSGQDGVRQSVTCGNGGNNASTGGAIYVEPLDMSQFNQHGVKFGAEFQGETTAQQIRLCMIPGAAGTGGGTFQLDQFPGLATGETKITIYLDDVEQVCIDGGLGNQVGFSLPPNRFIVDSFFDIDYGDFKASRIGGPYVNYELDLIWLLLVLFDIPGQPPVQGNRMVIETLTTNLEPSVMTEMSLTAGSDLAGARLRVTDMWRRKASKHVRGTGSALVEVCDYLDDDCNGAPDPTDPSGGRFLRVTNLGSSGLDGVSIQIPPTDVGARFNLAPPIVTSPGPRVSLSATGVVQGESSSRDTGYWQTEMVSLSLSSVSWDYTPVQSQTARVEIYDNGNFVGSVPNYVGTVDVATSDLPTTCGKEFVEDAQSLCFVACWPELSTFTLPGHGSFQGTELRVLAEGGVSTTIETLSLALSDLPGCDLNITGTPNAVSSSVLPANVPVSAIHAIGDAEIQPQPQGRLKISNLGSSGCDGFSVDYDDDKDFLGVEYKIDGMGDASDGPTEELHVTNRGRLQGDASSRDLGTLSLVSDGSEIRVTPDFATVQPGAVVRVLGFNQGSLVVDTTVPAGEAVASFSNWPDGGGTRNCSPCGVILANLMVQWWFSEPAEIPARPPGTPKNGKNTFMIDELIVEPTAAPGPLQTLTGTELRARDHEPFVFYDIILMADDPTAAPSVPTANSLALLPNYPNPFNPQTTVSFDLGRSGPAILQVFGLNGRLVDTLVERTMPAGRHAFTWDGTDAAGKPVASGTYFVQVRSGEETQARKVTLAK